MNQHENMRQQLESAALNEERDPVKIIENNENGLQIENLDPVVEEKKKEKKTQKVPRVNPEILTDVSKGLYKLYQENQATIKRLEKADPERFVGSLLSEVRNWGLNLLPRYDYNYFLERVQNVGKDPMVTTMMSRLRAMHVGELKEEEFMELYGQKPNQILEEIDKQVGIYSQENGDKAMADANGTAKNSNWRGQDRQSNGYRGQRQGDRTDSKGKSWGQGKGEYKRDQPRGQANRGTFYKQKSGNHYNPDADKRIK